MAAITLIPHTFEVVVSCGSTVQYRDCSVLRSVMHRPYCGTTVLRLCGAYSTVLYLYSTVRSLFETTVYSTVLTSYSVFRAVDYSQQLPTSLSKIQ